jgi:hypothetical protein
MANEEGKRRNSRYPHQLSRISGERAEIGAAGCGPIGSSGRGSDGPGIIKEPAKLGGNHWLLLKLL